MYFSKQEKNSYHLRIDQVSDYSYTDYSVWLEDYFDIIIISEETTTKPHYHCYLEGIKKPFSRTQFTNKFPLNKDRKYSLSLCKTNDFRNLTYIVKEGTIVMMVYKNYSLASMNKIIDEAKASSFTKEEIKKEGIYKLARNQFRKQLECGYLKKEYTRYDILNYCTQWYQHNKPFSEDHIYRLYNYIVGDSMYAAQDRNRIINAVIQKNNLSI